MGWKFNPFTGKLDITGSGGGSPTGPAGGDLTGTYPNPTVDGLQGNPVSNAVPVNGQVLQFDGTSWVPGAIPSGGSGGGGVVYFLNFNTAADAPVTNIPQTPNASKELGITAETTATSFTSAILSTASYDFLASFVTDLNVPSATAIPAGVWDFNIWAESTTANAANHVLYKIEVLKYDGVNAPVLLATSEDSYVYDPQDITQYVSSVVLPQTTILATDRIVVYLYGRATQSNKTITFHFGGNYPSHTHSTMPSVTGTGVVKVVNGVFQSPASTIVNSDVSASAAIDKTKIAGTAITAADTGTVTSTMIADGTIVDADINASAAIGISKLAMSTNRLLGRTTAGTGTVEEITVGTGLSLSAGTLSSTVTGGVTSVTGTSPIASSGGTTPAISIADAAADGTTKGAAAFNANDFNSASGVISLDYTNGQSASASNKGFLTSADWTTFNNKIGTGAYTTQTGLTMNTARLLGRTTAGSGAAEEITVGTGLSLTGGTLTNTAAGVTSVTATAPLTSSGGATPDISTSIATNRIVGRSTAGTGVMEELTPVGITVSGGNITGIGGTVGTVDNAVPRADGTGGYTVQDSGLIVEDAIVSFTGITGDAGTDVITATGSAFANGQPVRFTALSGGSGLNTTTNYFVREVSGATFKVETSIGGGAINFTTNIAAGTLLTGHSVSTNVTLSENTTATNSDLVLTPKGTGALIAGPKPDGTATGGNARGANAVDLQTIRTGGGTPQAKVASGLQSVISGGQSNTSSNTASVVAGGLDNTSSGTYSVVSGGSNNSATSDYSTVIGGYANAASGVGSVCGGGAFVGSGNNTTTATISAILCGRGGRADRFGMQAHCNGNFAGGYTNVGDAQRARFVLRCKTTTNAAVEMALDGGATYLGIPSGKVIACTINISGVKSDGSAVAHYVRQYAVKNVGGTSSEVYAPVTIGTDNAAGTTIALSANNTDDTLRIAVTGIASETWRWVASVDAVEIAYGT